MSVLPVLPVLPVSVLPEQELPLLASLPLPSLPIRLRGQCASTSCSGTYHEQLGEPTCGVTPSCHPRCEAPYAASRYVALLRLTFLLENIDGHALGVDLVGGNALALKLLGFCEFTFD